MTESEACKQILEGFEVLQADYRMNSSQMKRIEDAQFFVYWIQQRRYIYDKSDAGSSLPVPDTNDFRPPRFPEDE